jgi:hypothetical protein
MRQPTQNGSTKRAENEKGTGIFSVANKDAPVKKGTGTFSATAALRKRVRKREMVQPS